MSSSSPVGDGQEPSDEDNRVGFGDSFRVLKGLAASKAQAIALRDDVFGQSNIPIIDQWLPADPLRFRGWPLPLVRIYVGSFLRQQTCGARNWAREEISKVPTPKTTRAATYKRNLRTLAERKFHGLALETLAAFVQGLVAVVLFIVLAFVLPVVTAGSRRIDLWLLSLEFLAILGSFGLIFIAKGLSSRSRMVFWRLQPALTLAALAWVIYYPAFSSPQLATRSADAIKFVSIGVISYYLPLMAASAFGFQWAARRYDPAAAIVAEALWILHLVHRHREEWSSPDVRKSIKDSFGLISKSVGTAISKEVKGDRKPRVTHEGKSVAAYINQQSDAVFGTGGPRAALVLAQQCLKLSSQRAWLSFPMKQYEPEERKLRAFVRSFTAWIFLLVVMTAVHFSNLLSGATESWAWVVVLSYVVISIIARLDPDFEKRLSLLGSAFGIFGKRDQMVRGHAQDSSKAD